MSNYYEPSPLAEEGPTSGNRCGEGMTGRSLEVQSCLGMDAQAL
jgi:hypothetical protein